MTPAEKIALAKEAGFEGDFSSPCYADDERLLAFANLVEAGVREECAKVADERARQWRASCVGLAVQQAITREKIAADIDDIAAAIRSTDADHVAGDGK